MNALNAPGVKFGLISGGFYAIFISILFSLGIDSFQGYLRVVPVSAMIILALFAGLGERKLNGGFLAFGKAVMAIGSVFVISELMLNITEFTIYNFVDPDLHIAMKAYTIETTEKTIDMMSGIFQYQEGDVDDIMKAVTEADYHFRLTNALLKFVTWVAIDFVFALILAIIVRKEPKPGAQYNN